MVSEGQQFDHLDALLVQTLAPLMLLAGGQVFAWVQRRRKIGGKKVCLLFTLCGLLPSLAHPSSKDFNPTLTRNPRPHSIL